MKKLESIQWIFFRKVTGVYSKCYVQLLKELNMFSLERGRDRYPINYAWKITPQTGLHIEHSNRHGHLLKLLPIHVEQINQSSNTYVTRMWHELPKDLRDITDTTINYFKTKFHKYFDTPKIVIWTMADTSFI